MKTKFLERTLDFFKRKTNIYKYWTDLGLTIGEECEIYQNASFGSEPYLIEIGNKVRINRGVEFVTHDGGVWVLRNLDFEKNNFKINIDRLNEADLFGRIKIGNNVHIGTNAIIMPNVEIGNNSIIGCGAIVTRSIPDNSIAVGIPARVIESVQEYYEKNKENLDFTKKLSTNDKKKYLKNKYKIYS